MSYNNPSSLLQLAIQSLLRDDNLTITSLKHLPAEVFPSLFLEAHIHRRRETLKALVQTWPFERLPLGALLQDGQPEDPRFKAVMDGIDVLLKQEVPHRCKLRVLDLQFTGQKFWRMWTGVDLPVFSERRKLVDEGPSRNKKAKPYFEVCVDLYISRNHADRLSNYLLDWIRERKGVHLSCKTVMIYSLTRKSFRFLHAMPFCDIKELGIHCTLTFSTLRLLGIQLGMMNNLKRLDVCIDILAATTPEEDDWMPVCISEFTSAFHQLLHLQELYLKSPFFLQGHLHQLIRSLATPLEVFSLTNCRVTEGDLTHLFQSPHITHLKDLCLRGLPLTFVSEPLRALLEVNAATLQHLDLGLCGLQDPQLEALLPALSSCSQLSSLSLHGNRLSMATLEKLLRCTSGLSRLRQEIYPAPMETFNPQGILQPQTFDLLCTQIFKILKELKHSRSIVVSTGRCSYCARKMFRNWKLIILPCLSCFRDYKKLSFRPTGSE